MKNLFLLGFAAILLSCSPNGEKEQQPESGKAFPLYLENLEPNRELSAALKRSFEHYQSPNLLENELYTNFKYTELKGFDYHDADGTVSRRDPSKIIFENGKYYIWYTHRSTPTEPRGPEACNDTIPSRDWDLCDIWYATSTDGFTWEEQGVAVPRPEKPNPGWRSISTTDILKWNGKYYLYYQAFNKPSGVVDPNNTATDVCEVAVAWADSPDGPWTHVNKIVVPAGKEDEWDARFIHDPSPFIHDGKIYLYYKSGLGKRDANRRLWDCWGIAVADSPEGPFVKHPLNPVTNSGHETILFPIWDGIAAIVGTDGLEHYTIQYAKDWVNFEIASVIQLGPEAAGVYSPDAFTDTKNADGIKWGLSHFTNAGNDSLKMFTKLARFDCDLSLSTDDPTIKKSNFLLPIEMYFRYGLNEEQRARIEKENEAILHAK